MTQKTYFDLVSPDSKIISEEVMMAVIPGTEGDFGVLSGHMPLVASVRAGVVEVYREDMKHVSERIFIAGGVADVTGTQCTLLAEQAINVNDIDAADISRQITTIEEDLKIIEDETDKARLRKKFEILKAMAEAKAA